MNKTSEDQINDNQKMNLESVKSDGTLKISNLSPT